MWGKILRGFGCLGYLGLLGVASAFVAYVAFSQFVRRGVTPTPNVLAMSHSDAAALLADQGLTTEVSDDERYDDRVPAGHVLLQRPVAGTLVKRGSLVTLNLSRGPLQLEVPDVGGDAPQAAQVTLTAAGLTVGRTLAVYTEEGTSGTVVAQHPAGGTRAERGAPVDLFVASESSEVWVMPDLVDLAYENVKRYFEARGFRLGRVSYEIYTGIKPGTVLRQFPQAGHPLRRGDVIALSLATAEPGSSEAEPAAGAGSPPTPDNSTP